MTVLLLWLMLVCIPDDEDLPTPDDAEKAMPTEAVQSPLSCQQTQSEGGSVAEDEDTLIHAPSNKPAAGENTLPPDFTWSL